QKLRLEKPWDNRRVYIRQVSGDAHQILTEDGEGIHGRRRWDGPGEYPLVEDSHERSALTWPSQVGVEDELEVEGKGVSIGKPEPWSGRGTGGIGAVHVVDVREVELEGEKRNRLEHDGVNQPEAPEANDGGEEEILVLDKFCTEPVRKGLRHRRPGFPFNP